MPILDSARKAIRFDLGDVERFVEGLKHGQPGLKQRML